MTAHWLDALTFNADGLIPSIAIDAATGQVLMMAWQNREALRLTVQTRQAVYFSRSRGKLWHKGETSGHIQKVHEILTDCDGDTVILKVSQIGGIACHTGRVSCFYQRLDWDKDEPSWQSISPVIKNPDEIYGELTSDKPLSSQINQNNQTYSQAVIFKNSDETNDKPSDEILAKLDAILAERKSADKDSSYVASLYHKGLNKILEKIGEEATETIIAAKELELARSLGRADGDERSDLVYEVADLWFHSLVALSHLGLSGADVLAELSRRFGLSGIDEKNARNQ